MPNETTVPPSTHEPQFANGKICYIEIPATSAAESANFYHRAFGWSLRTHEDGSLSFDDTVGQVSGMFVPGRKPSAEAGLIISMALQDFEWVGSRSRPAQWNRIAVANRVSLR